MWLRNILPITCRVRINQAHVTIFHFLTSKCEKSRYSLMEYCQNRGGTGQWKRDGAKLRKGRKYVGPETNLWKFPFLFLPFQLLFFHFSMTQKQFLLLTFIISLLFLFIYSFYHPPTPFPIIKQERLEVTILPLHFL